MNGLSLITLKSFKKLSQQEAGKKQDVIEKNFEIKVSKDFISGSYSVDLDLIDLNKCILEILNNNAKTQLDYWKSVKVEEEYKMTQAQFKIERVNSMKMCSLANENILEYSNDVHKQKYIQEIESVLLKYKEIGVIRKYVTFGKNINFNEISESYGNKIYRLSLIEEFLEIAKKEK